MCQCKTDRKTLDIFSQNPSILMLAGSGCPQTHSSPQPSSSDPLMENRLRNINGPQFASLGVWDGS